jgi:hypothetical protein
MPFRIVLGLGVAFGVLWVILSLWYPKGKFSYANYLRIQEGMNVVEVQALLGSPGKEIPKTHVPHIVDWNAPLDSPERVKPEIRGDKFYKWQENPDSWVGPYVVIGVVQGKVQEKTGWWPSP